MGVASVFRQWLSTLGSRGYFLVIATAVLVVGVLAAVLGGAAARPVLGRCADITVFAGQGQAGNDPRGTPYDRFAGVIQKNIEKSFRSRVSLVSTQGSAFNVAALADLRPPGTSGPSSSSGASGASGAPSVLARCSLSIVGLATTMDAHKAVYQFEGWPVTTVRTVGPLWRDFIQVVVREPDPTNPLDRPVTRLADLCRPDRTVETGLKGSGTERTGTILFRHIPGCDPNHRPTLENKSLTGAIDAVRGSKADALLWVGGAPTPAIEHALAIKDKVKLTMLPLDPSLVAGIEADWQGKYGTLLAGSYQAGTLGQDDYPDIGPTPTISSSNAVLANQNADSDLVRFVAGLLVTHRAEFEFALWSDDHYKYLPRRQFDTVPTAIEKDPLYCVIRLHPAAADYYLKHLDLDLTRSCSKIQS